MISEQLRATLLSLKLISDRIKSLVLSLFDFRSTLMGDKGATRIRPLVVAKIVENGTEHCGFMAQAPNEDKQVFYDGITPDTGIFFFATKSEGLLSATEGLVDSFPLGVKSGVEAFYPIVDWLVCTQAPQDITSAASTWQTAVVQVGEVWRCKEEHKYYNSNNEYIGSVYVYEKVGNSEITLGEVKAAIDNIDIDTSDLAKEATLEAVGLDVAAAKIAAQNAETTAQATANKNEIIAQIQANAGIPTLTIPDSTASLELAPNTLYIFDNRTSTLTLTLGTQIVGIANEYHFFVVCGSTAPTINFPAGITWNGGSAPTIAANKTYEISILNNLAAYFEV